MQTRAIWGLIHEQKPYVDCTAFQIKKAKEYSRRVINLPCSTNLKEEDIVFVVQVLQRVLEKLSQA